MTVIGVRGVRAAIVIRRSRFKGNTDGMASKGVAKVRLVEFGFRRLIGMPRWYLGKLMIVEVHEVF